MLASESGSPLAELKSSIIYQLPRLSKAFDDIISRKDYQRMHLLNSLIILHNCDPTNLSIKLTKEIIYAYLNEENLPGESKLKYVFKLFRQVRNIAYVAYDLQIANTPFIIEISNEKSIIDFFQELLSAYNNGISATEMVRTIQKLLDSTVYNENCNSICLYQISKKMYQCIKQNGEILSLDNYFREWFQNKDSYLNIPYNRRIDFLTDGILKITFDSECRSLAEKLIETLDHTDNIRTGYYDREYNRTTLLIAMKRRCKNKSIVAFQVLKKIISTLRRMNIDSWDDRYLLVTKFFLRYLFGDRNMMITPTLHEGKCVICTRGKTTRIDILQQMIKETKANIDCKHEVQAMINLLQTDQKNDTCITVPGSTVIYNSNGQKLCEIDGIVIYPYRKEKQIIIIEAKNTDNKPGYGKKCLYTSLIGLGWKCDGNQINIARHDAYYNFSVGDEIHKV